jgi:hypothetical protein
MRRIGVGCLAVILLAIIVALCFNLGEDETEIEIEEGRIESVEAAPV